MKKLFLLILLLPAVFLAQEQISVKVRYLSLENVYLDGGRGKGLQVGDTLTIRQSQQDILLKVVYVADYSASCILLTPRAVVEVGDVATIVKKRSLEEPQEDEPVVSAKPGGSKPTVADKTTPSRKPKSRRKTWRGNISASWYGLRDQTAAGLDFDQPSFRINLRARELWQRPITFRLRTRSRYNQRSRTYNGDVPQENWRNRLYEASLRLEDRNQRLNFGVGRLIANQIGGIGYIDGGQVSVNVTPSWAFGVVGGLQPDWRSSAFDTQISKAASYLNFRKEHDGNRYADATLAFSGEYGDGEISREMLYWRSIYRQGKWGLYGSAEMDLNRGWRKEKAGNSLQLTSLFVNSDLRATDWLTIGATYDNRRSYWFYQIQSTPDSLFDDALRTGFRLNTSIRLPFRMRISTNGGYRDGSGGRGPTRSWGANLSQSKFIYKALNLYAGLSGFESSSASGTTMNGSLNWRIYRLNSLRLGYGRYVYRFEGNGLNTRRASNWVRFGLDLDLPQSMYLQSEYELRNGDDLDGSVFNVVLGYRL